MSFLKTLRAASTKRAKQWNQGRVEPILELLFRSNELCGEAGEAANFIKKYSRNALGMRGGIDRPTARAAIAKELADVIICTDRVAEYFSIDLAKAVKEKFNETSDKHGFTVKL